MTAGPKLLKLESNGVYREIPIVTKPVVYNPNTGLFYDYKDDASVPADCKVIERWTID